MPPPAPPPPGDPPSLTPSVLQSRPVGERSGFENLCVEVSDLTAHVAELRALMLRMERSLQMLIAGFRSFESSIRFSVDQAQETIQSASEEVLRSKQAVVELVPKVRDLEDRVAAVERRRVGNGEDG